MQKETKMAKEKEKELKFYEYSQNNTGGSFVTDDKLCHRLFIEAYSEKEADEIAEGLGCYWNGVDEGYDCECCGDRWYSGDLIDLGKNKEFGAYPVKSWVDQRSKDMDPVQTMNERYSGFEWVTPPAIGEKYGSELVEGAVKIRNIEEYAQVHANEYGWTSPDARIFYANGEVKDIYMYSDEKYKKKISNEIEKL